jgi:RNA polymerase sigma-70 factor (ECF subfamily)
VLLQWLAPLLGQTDRRSGVAKAVESDVFASPRSHAPHDARPTNEDPKGSTFKNDLSHLDFESVYEAHFEYVWRNLYRLGVLPKDVDDAAHDVFLVVHQKLPEFDGKGSIRAWLFAIARRVAWHYRRSLARKRTESLSDEDPIDKGTLEQSDLQSKREAITLVHRILAQLPEERRSVFILAELEQLTIPVIAEMLQIPVNTAYSRLRLARRDFEQKLHQIDASARRISL